MEAGKLLGIPVIDHLVIGAYRGEIYSFKENHPEMFAGSWDMSIFPEIKKAAETREEASEYKPSVIDRLDGKRALSEVLNNSSEKFESRTAKKREPSL